VIGCVIVMVGKNVTFMVGIHAIAHDENEERHDFAQKYPDDIHHQLKIS